MKNKSSYGLILLFVLTWLIYYYTPINYEKMEIIKILLTICTFLFAIFVGFFISKQGDRYSKVREKIANFDGGISALYRIFGHLELKLQKKVMELIKKDYKNRIRKGIWNYHFVYKSNIITSMHQLIEKEYKNKQLNTLKQNSVNRSLAVLIDLQKDRKNLIILSLERIPTFQWVIIYFLGVVLFITLSILPSYNDSLASLIKAIFASCIVSVIILLHAFDQLKFFEHNIGESSAQDILDIFEGKK